MLVDWTMRGRVWVAPDFTDTYKIIPQQYWDKGQGLDREELGKHAMEGLDPSFASRSRGGEFVFICAGRTFGGGGKSIEHPIYAILGAGIKAVIVESTVRYFYRNAINHGLPILVCPGITGIVKTGDEIEVALLSGEIRNRSNGKAIQAQPMTEFALRILSAGGYLAFVKASLPRPAD